MMNVLIDWGDGKPEQPNRHIERVEFIPTERPMARSLPEAGVLYVNPEKVRSIRTVDDQEVEGERLARILRQLASDDRVEGELLEDRLIRILRERNEARQLVPV